MKIVELITDPSSQQLSMSRLCLPVVVALDIGWVVAAVMGWPPKEALNPVSSMLGVITGGICGVYGLSTVKTGSGIVERIKTVFQKAA
jgi:hypothetical protein